VSVTFDDGGSAGSLTLTLDSSGLDLAGEFVKEWYLNYEGGTAVGSLIFGYNAGSDWLGVVPEPGSVVLFSTGLLVAGALMRRRR
jgi:hypothetical protein